MRQNSYALWDASVATQDAETLIDDFFDEVERVLGERGKSRAGHSPAAPSPGYASKSLRSTVDDQPQIATLAG